jgi:hypothetical protein
MPFLAGRGQAGRGMFGLGAVPGVPTFPNTPSADGSNTSIVVTFAAPAFNGRVSNYRISICFSYFGR